MSGVIWVPSGSYRVIYEYANSLVKRGHIVNIVFPISKVKTSLSISKLRKKLSGLEPNWFKLRKEINLLKIPHIDKKFFPPSDVIIASNWDTVKMLHQEFGDSDVKLFQFVHHYEGLTGHSEKQVDLALNLPIKKIAVSSWTKQFILNKGFSNVDLILNGVDKTRFKELKPFDKRPFDLCMAYVDKPIKNMRLGINILEQFKLKKPNSSILLFGPQKNKPKLNFEFSYFSRVSEEKLVHQIYNQSKVFLCTSKYEGFSFPQIEALACGCLLVSSDCGGNSDFAIDYETAFIVKGESEEAFITHLISLTDQESVDKQMKANVSEVLSKMSWENSTTQLEVLIS